MNLDKLKSQINRVTQADAALSQCIATLEELNKEIESLFDLDPHRYQYGIEVRNFCLGNLDERAERSIRNQDFPQREAIAQAHAKRKAELAEQPQLRAALEAEIAALESIINELEQSVANACDKAAAKILAAATASIAPFFDGDNDTAQETARIFPAVSKAQDRCSLFEQAKRGESLPKIRKDAHLLHSGPWAKGLCVVHQAEALIKMVE